MVISVLAATMLYLVFKKTGVKDSPLASLRYWVSLLLIVILLVAGMVGAYYLASSTFEKKPFNQQAWVENEDNRYAYVDDLISGEKLMGLSVAEVKELLGTPDYENDSTLIFNIGYSPEVFLNQTPDWLVTTISEEKVSSVHVDR